MTNTSLDIICKKAALLVCCFFMFSCENSMEEVNALGKKKIGVEEAENVEAYMSEGGIVKAKLTAPYWQRTETDTPVVEFPKTLHVVFYNDSTLPESYLFAKYGRYLEKQGKVLLRDSVVVFNTKGDTLHTNELWWDRDKQIFYTDKKVLIIQPHNERLVGDAGMKANQDFQSWELYKGSGLKNLPDSALPAN